MDLQQELRQHILNELLPGEDPAGFSDDFDLIGGGVLDSLAMVNLVTHLEQAYGVEVAPADLVPENFGSVRALAAFVQGKRAA